MAAGQTKSKGKVVTKGKKAKKRTVVTGKAFIKATFNNTIVTITDMAGGALSWGSAGAVGFSGAKKSTPFAAQIAAEHAAKKALEYGLKKVEVYVSGPGAGRETAIRALGHAGLSISVIKDITPLAHNGCRPPGSRRV